MDCNIQTFHITLYTTTMDTIRITSIVCTGGKINTIDDNIYDTTCLIDPLTKLLGGYCTMCSSLHEIQLIIFDNVLGWHSFVHYQCHCRSLVSKTIHPIVNVGIVTISYVALYPPSDV